MDRQEKVWQKKISADGIKRTQKEKKEEKIKMAIPGISCSKLKRCVRKVQAKGHDKSSAYAICIASLKGKTRRKRIRKIK